MSSSLRGSNTKSKRMATLFIYWDYSSPSTMRQLRDFQDVLNDRYASTTEELRLDHSRYLPQLEEALFYTIRNFLSAYDHPDSLLCIIYRGDCIIRGQDLFLTSKYELEDGIHWSGHTSSLDYRLLQADAPLYVIFDVHWKFDAYHLDNFLDGMRAQIENLQRLAPKRDTMKELSVLMTRGFDDTCESDDASLYCLTQAFETLSKTHTLGFSASDMHRFLDFEDRRRFKFLTCKVAPEVTIFPRIWPILHQQEHVEFDDPLDRYFRRAELIHDEGLCKVLRLSLDPSLQEFSFANGRPCLVAIKRFTSRNQRMKTFMKEAFMIERENLLKVAQWNHERILGMLTSFEIRGSKSSTMNLVFEYVSGGDLWGFLRLPPSQIDTKGGRSKGYPFSEYPGLLSDWKYAVFREVVGLAEALSFLHDNLKARDGFLIHRDIKPSNILIHKGKFKISDFGLSKFKGNEETSKTDWMLGSLMYAPPEKDSDLMGRARDCWACGCVFLEIAVMIRYGQEEGPPVRDEDTNPIDSFEQERRNSAKSAGSSETAIYSKTMDCVNGVLREFDNLQPGTLERAILTEGMTPDIRSMLELDPTQRITAEKAALGLKTAYESMQKDSRFLDELKSSLPSDFFIPRLITTPLGTIFETRRRASVEPENPPQRSKLGIFQESTSQSSISQSVSSDDTLQHSDEEESLRFRKRKRQN